MRNLVWLIAVCALLFAGTAFAAGGITGVVLTQQGAPVDQARASIWANGGCIAYVMTNAEGIFTLTDVAPGTYTLRVGKKQTGSATVEGVQVLDGQVTDVGPITLVGQHHGMPTPF